MFLDLIKNKSIAIVGPSNFLNNKKMGKLIDSHDIVIKINRFEKLSHDDYGNKVDILFCNFYRHIPHHTISSYNTKLIVGGHDFRRFKDNRKNFKRSKKKYNNIIHEYYPNSIPKGIIKDYIRRGRHKSTGFWIIGLLFQKLDIIKQLNIFGLDFKFNKYNKTYNSSNSTWYHRFDKELKLFIKLYHKLYNGQNIIIHDKKFLEYVIAHK